MAPHPFKSISPDEIRVARDVIRSLYKDSLINFREIFIQEPNKEAMKQFLELEHAAKPGHSAATKRPPRLAKVQYDVIGSDKIPQYNESVVDVEQKKRVRHQSFPKDIQSSLALWEFADLVQACKESDLFQKAVAEFQLPEGFELIVEPW